MKRTLLIAGLAALVLSALVDYSAVFKLEALALGAQWKLQSRAERFAHAQERSYRLKLVTA